MKTRLVRIIVLLLIVGVLFGLNGGLSFDAKTATVRAVGDLEIDWGVPSGQPIFVIENMAPGQTETRSVLVKNNADVIRPVAIRGVKTGEINNLSQAINFSIKDGSTTLYGAKTLAQFIAESSSINGIQLFMLSPGQEKIINFTANFQNSAVNSYQNSSVVFDLIVGIAFEIPKECQKIKFAGEPIFGTSGSDRLRGTRGNDLILALEGNDRVNGNRGEDCIIGGAGNDKINGEAGNDILIGGKDYDIANGDIGKDVCFAEVQISCEL